MQHIINFVQTGLAFVVLLGVLVFIHEFGHFIIAKAFGMRVETFSIGMGKKILTFTRGETEYAISLVPLGGYVKITGQDPREEVPPELTHRSFRDKPIYQRTAVVLAGPIFNAALAILVFVFLFNIGIPSKAPVLERVLPDSPAAQAGFQTGDKVVAVSTPDGNTVKIYDLGDLEKVVGSSVGKTLSFDVRRPVTPMPALVSEKPTEVAATTAAQKTQAVQVSYAPEMGEERDSTIGVMRKRGVIKGAEKSAPSSTVFARKDSWAETKGLQGYFLATELSYNSQGKTQAFAINNLYDLENAWSYMAGQVSADRGELHFKGQLVSLQDVSAPATDNPPEPKEETLTFKWEGKSAFPQTLAEAGFISAEMVIAEVKAGSPAEKLGLKGGDWIQKVNGEEALSFASFRERLQEIATHGEPVEIEWIRDGEMQKAKVTPDLVNSKDPFTEISKQQFQIGAAFMAFPVPSTIEVVKAENFGESISLGLDRTVGLTKSMLSSFYLLASGEISPKTLGGPLLIAKISGESLKQGYVAYFRMMAFISLNLFILNLLPIPVLDGGHLVLFCVEAIRRRPLSIRAIEIWTTAGFFLLMGLVAIVFFNDLSRLGLFRIFRS